VKAGLFVGGAGVLGRGTVRIGRGAGWLVWATGLLVRGTGVFRWRLVVADLANATLGLAGCVGLALGDNVMARDGELADGLLTGVPTVGLGGAAAK
jgi:hypothetical protein